MNVIDRIYDLFATRGQSAYFGEPVSQLEHALQAAYFADQEQAPNTLVVACLLHDVGHLLHSEGEDAAQRGIDTRHEEAASQLLLAPFGAAVAEPIRLHVAAKRYLCHADPDYLNQLSPASQESLRLQGGPMTPEEAAAFLANPYAEDAIRLRHWDDQAKIPNLKVPNLETYRPALQKALLDDYTQGEA